MILDNDKIEVINRTGGTVAYTIDELHLKRRFLQNESKQIEMGELRKLSWTPGGKVLLEQCLVIKNDDAIKELLGSVEPEYNYTEAEVKNLLINGSLDELKDAIDFAPAGVIDLIKKISVDVKLNDMDKRNAILEMTNFDVTKAIEVNKMTIEEKEDKTIARRVSEEKKEETSAPVRRVVTKK